MTDERGWLYIITTRAMPELVKIGFTLRDPAIRARALGRTGLPHPYVVEHQILVSNPRKLERQVHEALASVREGKEWFRCSVSYAMRTMNRVTMKQTVFDGSSRTRLDSIPPTPQLSDSQSGSLMNVRIRHTGTYLGLCRHCREWFSVTLTRYDSCARCPDCFRVNDIAEFKRHEFRI
jgi:hypothetical protein